MVSDCDDLDDEDAVEHPVDHAILTAAGGEQGIEGALSCFPTRLGSALNTPMMNSNAATATLSGRSSVSARRADAENVTS